MRRRAHVVASVVSGVLTVSCASGGSGVVPTTASNVSLAPTTRPASLTTASTTAASTGTAITTVQPSTTAPAPFATSIAPTTTALDTTPAGSLIGPAPQVTDLGESPLATRNPPVHPGNERYRDGVMFRAANPAYDRSFVLTMYAADFAEVRPAAGWTFAKLASDRQWTPGSCGETASTFVGHRWEVYIDSPGLDAGQGAQPDPRNYQLVSYDVRTGEMRSYLETPNQVTWFTYGLFAYDDHSVGILFDPDGSAKDVHTSLALRRIDLATGSVADEPVELPPGTSHLGAAFATDGRIRVFVADGALVGKLGEPLTLAGAGEREPWQVVDGIALEPADPADPAADVQVKDSAGKILAAIHQWRFTQGNGPGLGFYGWASGRGYFGAFRSNGSDSAGSMASPGVYDAKTATWDWVFDEASPAFSPDHFGAAYFITGLA
jgi:hypothetical protein